MCVNVIWKHLPKLAVLTVLVILFLSHLCVMSAYIYDIPSQDPPPTIIQNGFLIYVKIAQISGPRYNLWQCVWISQMQTRKWCLVFTSFFNSFFSHHFIIFFFIPCSNFIKGCPFSYHVVTFRTWRSVFRRCRSGYWGSMSLCHLLDLSRHRIWNTGLHSMPRKRCPGVAKHRRTSR